MKYFVIGGLGFVGRYLVKALQERKDGEVIVCDVVADRFSGIRIDIKDKDSLRRLDIANRYIAPPTAHWPLWAK